MVQRSPCANKEEAFASGNTRGSSGPVHCFGLRRRQRALEVTVVAALRVRCRTACSSQSQFRMRIPAMPLHNWPAPLQLGPVFLDAHRADPQSVAVPNTRAIVTFYFGAPFAVSPSPVHALPPVTSSAPAALAVAQSQQTGCRHGTKERA